MPTVRGAATVRFSAPGAPSTKIRVAPRHRVPVWAQRPRPVAASLLSSGAARYTGAMPHVVTRPPFSFFGSAHLPGRPDAPMEVHVIPVWEDNYAFILACRQTGEAAVVDAPEAKVVLEHAASCGLRLATILNTHTHADHIGINRALQKAGKLEEFRVFGCAGRGIPGLTDPVEEGSTFQLGALPVRVMQTEGHQDGHVSFVVGDVVFCGDTLFAGGCGYLFDGPPAKMYTSLHRLAALPPQTRVCCAHEYTLDNLKFAWSVEPDNQELARRIVEVRAQRALGRATVPSTIEVERATNPFLRTESPTLRVRVAAGLQAAGRSEAMDTPVDVFTATRILKDLKHYRALPEADLPV